MEIVPPARGAHAPATAILTLALSVVVASVVAASLPTWRQTDIATAVAVGAGLGLLLAAPVFVALAELDRALMALARGGARGRGVVGRWLLGSLFGRLDAINARVTSALDRERQTQTYREEVTRQVSEAAAREERNRLARELHDSIKQQLFSIDVSAAAARARAGADSAGALTALDDIQRGTRAAQAEMTALLQQLRPAPLENAGLAQALRDQGEALSYRTGAEVTVVAGDLPAGDALAPHAQEELFRMAQEALANIARHARARHVWLRLEWRDGEALLEVRDDGQGFDVAAPAGMGLANLRERARALGGAAEIMSAPGAGTTVHIHLPLSEPLHIATPQEVARQAALDGALERGVRWERWSMNLIRVAFALLLLGLPALVVALGFVGAALVAALGRYTRAEVTRLAGVGSEPELRLRGGGSEALAWIAIGLALCAWYLPVRAPRGESLAATLWLAAILSAALLALGLWNWAQGQRSLSRLIAALPEPRLRREIEGRWQDTLTSWGVITALIVIGLIFGSWGPAFPPRADVQWTDGASVALAVLLIALTALETWLIWRLRVARGATGAAGARETVV